MQSIEHIAEVAAHYDAFLVDLWGVIHDGVRPFTDALECLRRLRGHPVLLLSNAPRRVAAVQSTLRDLGVDDSLYTHILTSGEATWRMLHDGLDKSFPQNGARVLHIGPLRDRGLLDGLGVKQVADAAAADYILNTGPDDEREGAALTDFLPDLNACLAANLPMVCANPDLEIVRGSVRILCAGALAQWYECAGGRVRWVGKPDVLIYRRALEILNKDPRQVLAVGDSLRTDIAGAQNAGLDSVWVLSGLHHRELEADHTRAEATAQHARLNPNFAIKRFVW